MLQLPPVEQLWRTAVRNSTVHVETARRKTR